MEAERNATTDTRVDARVIEQAIQQRIELLGASVIHQLHVSIDGNAICMSGNTRTYDARAIAISIAMHLKQNEQDVTDRIMVS